MTIETTDALRNGILAANARSSESLHPFQGPRGTVTILLPAKNEEEGIAKTLAALPVQALQTAGFGVEVLVVDGHSTDRTVEIATASGARVIRQEGKGKGWAIRTARQHVRGRYIVMLDADDSYPAEAIPQFVAALESGVDVALGSRFRGEILEGAMGTVNRFGNRALSLLASTLFLHRVTDVCTGMWGFRREAFMQIPLTSQAFEVEAEMFARFAKSGHHIVELPIQYRPRAGETKLGKLKDGVLIGLEILKQRFIPAGAPLFVEPLPELPPPTTSAPLRSFDDAPSTAAKLPRQ
ncbi:MAG TPA: glycosyltransferase family 2 protein [Candidatus Thermoplasmatota archaeon]|nr:glycosyltransferase family 2 protein [Candidatus Thermoplasmatota archaeon]